MGNNSITRRIWSADWETARSSADYFTATEHTALTPSKIYEEEYTLDALSGYSTGKIVTDIYFATELKKIAYGKTYNNIVFMQVEVNNFILPFIFLLSKIQFKWNSYKATIEFKSLRFMADAVVAKKDQQQSLRWAYLGNFFSSDSNEHDYRGKWQIPATKFRGVTNASGVSEYALQKGKTLKETLNNLRDGEPYLAWTDEKVRYGTSNTKGFLVEWESLERENRKIIDTTIIKNIEQNLRLEEVSFTTKVRNIYYGVEDGSGNIAFGGNATSKKFFFGDGGFDVQRIESGENPQLKAKTLELNSKNIVNKGNRETYSMGLNAKSLDFYLLATKVFRYRFINAELDIYFNILKINIKEGVFKFEVSNGERFFIKSEAL